MANDHAAHIAAALRKYEDSLAGARADLLGLGGVLLDAQRATVSATTGHQIFSAITASQAGLDQALSHADAAHRLAEALGKRLGVDVTGYGEQKDRWAPSGRQGAPARAS